MNSALPEIVGEASAGNQAAWNQDISKAPRDPRSAAYALDVEDPYYGDHADFEEVLAVIEAALPGLHDWVDEQLAQNGHG